MVTVERFYWLPHCSTCQKAEQFLKDKGVEIQTYIDVKTQTVSRETIIELANAMGGAEALFSKRAMKYRSMGLDKMTLSAEQLLDYMHQEYTFIKRPVLVTTDGRVLAGFSAKQYELLLKS